MKNRIIIFLLSMVFAGLTYVIAKFGLKNVSVDFGLGIKTAPVFVLFG